jgi:hypothetical protein
MSSYIENVENLLTLNFKKLKCEELAVFYKKKKDIIEILISINSRFVRRLTIEKREIENISYKRVDGKGGEFLCLSMKNGNNHIFEEITYSKIDDILFQLMFDSMALNLKPKVLIAL